MVETVQISSRRAVSRKQATKVPAELLRANAHVGLFSRVAKSAGVTTSHVAQVAKGKRTSPRIVAAIIEEVRKIDTAVQKGRAA